ncbi:MAG: hypothetical protein ACRED5_00720, partial [Propylenella sp.]
MNARTSRSAKAGKASTDNRDQQTGLEPDLMFDDLVDARFDEQGRLSQVGRGSRQRIAEQLDARPPATSAAELEQAIRKLAEGLDAIERQSRTAKPEAQAVRAEAGKRDFVTYSLDRLEARLEALSRRLQSRATSAEAAPEIEAEREAERRADPSLAIDPDYAAERAELRRMAEAERVRREAEAAAEAWQLEAEEEAAADAARRAAETEAMRRADEEATEARRRAEDAEAEVRRRMEEIAEAKRRADEEAAEARRRAEAAEAEALRHAEAAERERLARLAEARREAEAAAEMQRQFAEIEARIDALQTTVDQNQIEPVRQELIELLGEIEDLTRNHGSVGAALEQINARLGEMEVKVNAARNMAGNRLGDIQDRLVGLTERLDDVEIEIPGFDAIRENQSAILERFDRMEGLVHHLASPEELLDRVDGLRRQLQTIASQEEVGRIGERILGLAERLDALPETLSDAAQLRSIENQLGTLASELQGGRQQRMAEAADLDRRLSELSALLHQVEESGRTPDLSALEERLAEFAARFDRDRAADGEALSRIERRLGALASAVDEQEDSVSTELIAGLTHKIDMLADAIDAQDATGARRDVDALGDKLDQLSAQVAKQAEHLSRAQIQPLEARIDHMQRQLDEVARRAEASSDQFRPFARMLQEISERVSTLGAPDAPTPLSLRLEAIEERIAGFGNGKGPDLRALQTQLEGVVSRLELLKGRSIDPARLTELFDRVDSAIRALPEDRFDRLERKLADAAIPPDRFDRLEKAIAKSAPKDIEGQFERLERRIAEAIAAGISEEDIHRLERRIAEAIAAGISEEDIHRLERRIAEGAYPGISEEEVERLARRVAESAREALGDRGASDISEERFARLERKLETITLASSSDGEFPSVEDIAELRGDIVALRRELRSLPALGGGEANLGEVLQGIAARIDRLPQNLPATTADLETQIERIARLIDDPSHSRLALAHIEASLKSIEERLEETRRAFAYRPA